MQSTVSDPQGGKARPWLPSIALLSALLALVPFWAARAQRGAITIPQPLDALTQEAALILRGRVAGARVEPHPQFENLQTVVVSFKVEEALKGKVGETYTFRQYIWDVRDRFDAAGYRKGQHLLLFMTQPSRYGLSSPVGLQQGRFRILRDAEGRELAVNGVANIKLFEELPRRLQQRGIALPAELAEMVEEKRGVPVAVSRLEDLIRILVEAR